MPADGRPSGLDPARLARAEARLGALVDAGVVHGAVLGVGDVGGASWFAAAGSGRVAGRDEPLTPRHRFLLTSVTKPLTATQVLLLVEDGLLDLDEPLASYLPDFGVRSKHEVTMRHLLSMTGGLNDVANLIEGPPCPLDADGYIQAALASHLSFRAGTGWAYCSPGFWVMAEVVNRLAGVRYTDHLVAAIAGPLGLADTRYEPGPAPERFVEARTAGAWDAHLPEQVRRAAYPAGGVVSTAPDLVAFGRSFLDGGPAAGVLLGRPARELLFREHARGFNRDRPCRWSLGWELGGPGSLQSARTLFHHGASGTGLWVDGDNGLVVVLLTADWWLHYSRYAEIVNCVLSARR
jgi:CubicO group peptidase (beta-lactamase class C family)